MEKKADVHRFIGMNRDSSAYYQNPQFLWEARNIRFRCENGETLSSITNEKGTTELNLISLVYDDEEEKYFYESYTIEGEYVGHAVLNKYLVVFVHSTNEIDTIIRIDNDEVVIEEGEAYDEELTKLSKGTYYKVKVLFEGNLGLDPEHPIEAITNYENENIQKVYWIDGINQPRIINIAKEDYSNEGDPFAFVQELALNEEVTISSAMGNGLFPAGVIQYCISYYNKFLQETNFVYTSPVIPICFTDRGGAPDEVIPREFTITVKNVDTNFEYIRLYSLVRTSLDAVPQAFIVKDLKIEIDEGGNAKDITFVDDYRNLTSVDPSEILYNSSRTKIIPQSFSAKNGTLFFGNYKFENKNIYNIINDGFVDSDNNKKYEIIMTKDYVLQTKNNLYNSYYNYDNILDSYLAPINKNSALSATRGYIITDEEPSNDDTISNATQVGNVLEIDNEEASVSGVTLIIVNENIVATRNRRDPGNILSSSDTTTSLGTLYSHNYFKAGNIYRFGVQFQDNVGHWSDPIYLSNKIIDSYLVNDDSYIPIPEKNDNLSKGYQGYTMPYPKITLDLSPYYSDLIDNNYKKVRPVVVLPTPSERVVAASGVVSPTVYNLKDRRKNSPYAQSSWFWGYNPPQSNTLLSDFSDKSKLHEYNYPYFRINNQIQGTLFAEDLREESYIPALKTTESLYFYNDHPYFILGEMELMDWYDSIEKNVFVNLNKDRNLTNVEKYNYQLDMDHLCSADYAYDYRVFTFHSPDVTEDSENLFSKLEAYLQITGLQRYYNGYFTSSIETSSSPIGQSSKGVLDVSLDKYNTNKILGYQDFYVRINESAKPYVAVQQVYTSNWNYATSETEYTTSFKNNIFNVYPFNRSGSLNNDTIRGAEEGTRSAVLKNKKWANLSYLELDYDFPSTYLSNTNLSSTGTKTIEEIGKFTPAFFSNTDNVSLVKVPYSREEKWKKSNLETLTAINYYGNVNTIGMHWAPYYIDSINNGEFWSTWKSKDGGHFFQNTLINGKPNTAIAHSQEGISIKYKSTPHLVFGISNNSEDLGNNNNLVSFTNNGVVANPDDSTKVTSESHVGRHTLYSNSFLLKDISNLYSNHKNVKINFDISIDQDTLNIAEGDYVEVKLLVVSGDKDTRLLTNGFTTGKYIDIEEGDSWDILILEETVDASNNPFMITLNKNNTSANCTVYAPIYNITGQTFESNNNITSVLENIRTSSGWTGSAVSPLIRCLFVVRTIYNRNHQETAAYKKGVGGSWKKSLVKIPYIKISGSTEETSLPNSASYPYDLYTIRNNINSSTQTDYRNSLYYMEVINSNINYFNIFGGMSEGALKKNMWIPAGEPVSIEGLEEEESQTVDLYCTQGDTYFSRWDCLKTYPYTNEDENNIIEIGSFMVESYNNVAGRYDKNRGRTDNTNISPTNFNLINKVYTQKNNFFNYFIHDSEYYKINNYETQLTWTLTHQQAAETDAWTNIIVSNALNLDGDKGKINALHLFKDSLFAFQDTGTAVIKYNERVQINPTDGVPIEIANSQKVEGYQYLSDSIGCINKFSIINGTTIPFFISSRNGQLVSIAEGITDLSTQFGFNYWYSQLVNTSWNPNNNSTFSSYDYIRNYYYTVTQNEILCFSELDKSFISFYDYTNVVGLFNLENDFVAIRKEDNELKIYKLFTGEYNYLFDDYKSNVLTFVSNLDTNFAKTFTNMNVRANFIDVSNNNGDLSKDLINLRNSEYKSKQKNNNKFFNKIRLWNEYQDTGEVALSNQYLKKDYPRSGDFDVQSNTKRRFREWHISLPRDKAHALHRLRSNWVFVKLIKDNSENTKNDLMLFDDLDVTYYV